MLGLTTDLKNELMGGYKGDVMERIALIGSGGSGKSTLARQLGEILKIDVYHLDSFFWKPNWVSISREELASIQMDLVKKEKWIIDGHFSGTMDIRLKAADTIIFLDFPRTICVYRVFKRMVKYRNQTRPDMGEGCEEKLDIEFLKWLWEFPKTKRPGILKKLEQLPKTKNFIILKSPREVKRFLEKIDDLSESSC